VLAEQIGRVGVIDWQMTTGHVRLSASALAIYGLTQFDGRYDTWVATVHPDDSARLKSTIDSALHEKAHEYELEFRIVRQSDKALRWINARRLVFYDDAGNPVRTVGVSVDVTDRKQADVRQQNFTDMLEAAVIERTRQLEAENEARMKAEELLRQSQKMEVVGQLTGGVAHDFNNLLTVIQGGLEMIGRQAATLAASPASARIARGTDMALEGVRRAARLTDRLLAFARRQPLEPRAIDANRLVSGTCELLRRTMGESITLETVLADGLWLVHADPNQLENAVLNLAVNARDALPDGGSVVIETANCHLDEAYVGALSEPISAGHYVMISVSDNGMGMSRETVERAFEPFFTTKGVGKGTGLGLSQVYGFVRQSAGHVAIYSEIGEGTSVRIYLPRDHDDAATAGEMGAADDARRDAGGETILLVEDDEALRTYSTEVLHELGYKVLVASHAAAALEFVAGERPIDLLFTDIVMPGGMNGRQLADAALQLRPGLRVLFTTGYTADAIVHHGRLDPDVELITKPYGYDALSRKLRALLDAPPKSG